MVKKKSKKSSKVQKTTKVSDDSKLFAFLAVFLSIIGFILALATKKEDKYVMYYAKQSLVLFIASVILWIAVSILTIITFGIGAILMPIISIAFFIFWVIQIIYSLSGEMKPTPVVGDYAKNINL